MAAGDEFTASKALALMSQDKRIFLQKKEAPTITTANYSAQESHDFTSTHLDTTAIQKREAHARGVSNISRLAAMPSAHLDDEIAALESLRTDLHGVIDKHFEPGVANAFESKGVGMANGAQKNVYRTGVSSEFTAFDGDIHKANGWDEFAQTSVTHSRASGRAAALKNLAKKAVSDDDIARHGKLSRIHELMSVTTSYVRGDTAGIASEHDDDPTGTRAQHPTAAALRGDSGGSNSTYNHRLRTGVMQTAEQNFINMHSAGTFPLMADLQSVRLDAATLSTTHAFNAPVTDSTHSALSKEVPAKQAHIHYTREAAKDIRAVLQTRGAVGHPPPSPRRLK